MFCPNCGKEFKEGARFCTGCGTPLSFTAPEEPIEEAAEEYIPSYEPEEPVSEPDEYYEDDYDGYGDYYDDAPAPVKSKKPLIITLAVIAAAVVVGLVLYFAVFAKGGLGQSGGTLETAQTRTMNAFATRSEVTAMFKDANSIEKFGVNVKVDDLGEILKMYNSYMAMIDIEAELDIAAEKDGKASVTLNADGMGLKASAGIYTDGEGNGDIAVSIPKFLKEAYGVSLGTLADDFEDSIFNPESDTDYSLPEYMYTGYKNSLDVFAEGAGSISPEIFEKLMEELKTNEDSKIELEKSKEKIDIGGEEVSCEVYKGSLDEEKLESIIDVIEDWLDDNDELEDVSALITNVATASGMNMSQIFKEIKSELKELDIDLDLEFDVYKGYLSRFEISGKIQGEKVKIEVVYGTDPSKTDEVSFKAKVADQDFSLVADLSKADDNKISAEIESKSADIYFEFDFVYDEKDEKFELTAKNDYREFKLEGGMKATEDTISISDPEFYRNGEQVFKLKGVTITFTKNPTIHTLKDDFPDGYTNVLKLDEDEFEEFGDKIYDIADEIG